MYPSKVFLLALATVSSFSFAQVPTTNSGGSPKADSAPINTAAYNKNPIVAKENIMISDANKRLISSNVLCQNLPVVGNDKVATMQAYSDYLLQVADLFASNSQNIQNRTVGINQDSQMSYSLLEPVSIIGISFDVVNITQLKDVNGNYFQISATKPLVDEDVGKIKNIPSNDKLTISTKDKKLSIICNIKIVTAE